MSFVDDGLKVTCRPVFHVICLSLIATCAGSCGEGTQTDSAQQVLMHVDIGETLADTQPGAPGQDALADLSGGSGDTGGADGLDLAGGTYDVGPDFGGERFGQPCEEHSDCPEGWCAEGPDGKVCSVVCTDHCPAGWLCKLVKLGEGQARIAMCVPGEARVCEQCSDRGDCGGAPLCARPEGAEGDQAVCLLGCAGDAAFCPSGFECAEVGWIPGTALGWACVPEAGTGCCGAAREGLEEACAVENEHGICIGVRTCRGLEGWGICSAPPAGPELCDRHDNDCDGETDEGLGTLCSCGDGQCAEAGGENPRTCSADCPPACGDALCSPGESPEACPEDCCGKCGDGRCLRGACGEDAGTCPGDCAADCGNGVCEPGENPAGCETDCPTDTCGNGVCEPADGGVEGCPADCRASCGNCVCEALEDFLVCPTDCGYCGDGVCSPCAHLGETSSCAADCPLATEVCNGVDDDGDGAVDEETCDDGDACTEDLCVPEQGACLHPPAADASRCDDGDSCTYSDSCSGGVCGGEPIEGCCASDDDCEDDGVLCNGLLRCDKSNANPSLWRCVQDQASVVPCDQTEAPACMESVCVPSQGGCTMRTAAEGMQCDDGDLCTRNDRCEGGVCVPGPAVVCVPDDPCREAGECDPGTGNCMNPRKPEGAACDDGDACTLSDTCRFGTCTGAYTLRCVSSDPCLEDGVCDPSTGECSAPPAAYGTDCDDGDACTRTDFCQAGRCVGQNPVVCQATDLCHAAGVCDPLTGACSAPPGQDGVPCDDGDHCTEGDACAGGTCEGSAVTCDDGEPCTDDSCDPAVGCIFEDNTDACDDGNPCTLEDVCADGRCRAGKALECTAGGVCRGVGVCDPDTGECSDPPAQDLTLCDDGDGCTVGDICEGGVCQPGIPWACGVPGDPCTENVCVSTGPDSRDCQGRLKTEGTPCVDANTCTYDERCTEAGECVGTVDMACCPAGKCDDGNACTADSCDPITGCVFEPRDDGALCVDGNLCNGEETCESGICMPGEALACDDGDPCTTDTCDPAWGCVHTHNTALCDDGDACTRADACSEGVCVGGDPVVCTAADTCHVPGVCDPETGLCSDPAKADGTPCDDGSGCSQVDTCLEGRCVGADPVVCVASDQCHVAGFCVPETGECTDPPKLAGSTCDDGDVCTEGETCVDGRCDGGSPLACDDGDPCTEDSCQPGVGCVHESHDGPCDVGLGPGTGRCVAGACAMCNVRCGQGACENVLRECVDGQPQPCEPLDVAAPEQCNGRDDDCDGTTDEGFSKITCGLGPCRTEVEGCVDGEVPECIPLPISSPEVCDGNDNDCDDLVDEDLADITCGSGPCANSVTACIDGEPQSCMPLPTPEGTCDAPSAPCLTTTHGIDACGNACTKVGPAHCYTVHPACRDSNPGSPTNSTHCDTPRGNYDCGLSCHQWPNTIGADCTYCVNTYCRGRPGKDVAQFRCANIPVAPTP